MSKVQNGKAAKNRRRSTALIGLRRQLDEQPDARKTKVLEDAIARLEKLGVTPPPPPPEKFIPWDQRPQSEEPPKGTVAP